MRKGMAGVALAASACTAMPVAEAPGSMATSASPSVAPAASPSGALSPEPGGSIPAPGPSVPSPDASTPRTPRLVLDAPAPCVGTPVTAVARGLGAVRRVAFHLVDGPRFRPDVVPDDGARLGEADVDATGAARLTFTLDPRYTLPDRLGELVLQPQGRYRVAARDAASGGTLAEAELFLAAGPSPCPPDRYAAAPTLRWDPPAPCGSTPSHLRGAGFTGPVAHLRFEAAYTRFGDGPRIEREVPVAADGTFDFAFVPDEIKAENGTPFFTERADLEAMAYDGGTRRLVRAPLPYCNAALVRALAASSIPLKGGITGWLTRGGSPPPGPELEVGAFHSAGQLGAFLGRHGLGPNNMRFDGTDFTRQIALMVVSGPADGASRNEIVSVEHTARGLLVHVVRWHLALPPIGDLAFDFVELDRRDEVVSFAPIATGSWGHRAYLAPWLDARGAIEIQEHRAP